MSGISTLVAAWALGLLTLVSAQTVAPVYDLTTGVTFWTYSQTDTNATWGYVFPYAASGSTPPDEFVGIFQAPTSGGWIGNSLGGAMRSNPLLVGWVDGTTPKLSSRWANDYAPPGLYGGPRLTILGSSGTEGGYQRIVYRCQNCTRWTGGANGIPANGTHVFGFAYHDTQKPANPSDPTSGLYRHSYAGQFSLDLAAARTPSYNFFLQRLIDTPPGPIVVDPPPISSTFTPTSTPTQTIPTTTPTGPSSTTNNPPGPTQTMYGQCGGVGYAGPTLCPPNGTCKYTNTWFSQCVPL